MSHDITDPNAPLGWQCGDPGCSQHGLVATGARHASAERLAEDYIAEPYHAQVRVHTFSPDDRARVYNEGFDEGWAQAHEDLTRVISVLENYGDHHEWCKYEPGFLPCECGYERELHELRGLRDQVKYLPSGSLLRNAAEESRKPGEEG